MDEDGNESVKKSLQRVYISYECDDPDDITAKTRIQPSEVIRIGDVRARSLVWNVGIWTLESGVDKTELFTSVHLDGLIARLKPGLDYLATLGYMEPQVHVVVNMNGTGQSPGFVIRPDQIMTLATLNAALDVDIYT